MGIISYIAELPGQVGDAPRRVKVVTTDSLTTVNTAGYFNNRTIIQSDPIKPTDFIDIVYSYNTATGAGTNATLLPSFSNGVITTSLYVNPGNVTAPVVSGNIPKFSGTTGLEIDSGIAATSIALSVITSPDAQSDLIWYDITATAAALATAGKVNVQVSSGTKQYLVRDIRVNKSTGLSGGGGDRLLSLTDGTSAYNTNGITAAVLGTPINTVWGGTGNPLPGGSIAFDTATVAGANLYLQYIGGTTDYSTGSVIISVLVQRSA